MLPKLPNNIRHSRQEVIRFGGLNVTATARDGEFTDCSGVSTRDYPFLKQRTQYTEVGSDPAEAAEWGHYDDPMWAMFYNGDLYVNDWPWLKKNGTSLGMLSISQSISNRNIAIVNTKMIFWGTSTKYLDLTNDTLHSLEKYNIDEREDRYTISGDTITYTTAGRFDSVSVGDVVDVYGKDTNDKVAEGKRIIVSNVTSTTIEFEPGSIIHREPRTNPTEIYGPLNIRWSLPDLDYICESGNRLWGVSNSDRTIYVSALGDPSTFFDYSNDLGSYSVAVAGDGNFTGICAYMGYVCVWKEDRLYKILGSYPSEYYMVESVIPGVSANANGSLTVINGILYYLGQNGYIYSYGGNRPNIISYQIGNGFSEGIGTSDGERYYAFLRNASGQRMYVYDIAHQMWVKHDIKDANDNLSEIPWAAGRLFVQATTITSGDVTTTTRKLMYIPAPSDVRHVVDSNMAWYAEMVPVTEQTFNRKGYTKIILRLDMATGSTLKVYAKEDRRAYREVFSKNAASDCTMTIPIRLGRCDRYQIKMTGTGEVTIRGLAREHVTGSEIN